MIIFAITQKMKRAWTKGKKKKKDQFKSSILN